MPFLETPHGAVITARRAPDGWIAYRVDAPAVCGYGPTEEAALRALLALFGEE